MHRQIHSREGRCLSGLLAKLLVLKLLFPVFLSFVSLYNPLLDVSKLLVCSSTGFKYVEISEVFPDDHGELEHETTIASECSYCSLYKGYDALAPDAAGVQHHVSIYYLAPEFVAGDVHETARYDSAHPRAPPIYS